MSQTRTRSKTTKPSAPKTGKDVRNPLDAFSEENATDLATHLRQIRHFYRCQDS